MYKPNKKPKLKRCSCCCKEMTSMAYYRMKPVCRRCFNKLRIISKSKINLKEDNIWGFLNQYG